MPAARSFRPVSSVALVLACSLALAPWLAFAAEVRAQSIGAALRDAVRPLEPLAGSGVLYDRVLALARWQELDGGESAPAVTFSRWRQACDELRRATLGAPAAPAPAAIAARMGEARRSGWLAIGLIDRTYEQIPPAALASGALRAESGRIVPGPDATLGRARLLTAAVLAQRTYRGGALEFVLDPEACSFDPGAPPPAVAIDFADGLGPRPVAFGERVSVRYGEPGTRVLEARVLRADGTRGVARFALAVEALAAPTPDDTLHVTASVPWQGTYGTGEAYVRLAPGHAAITNPVVVIEGFDLDNSMFWDELYALLDQQDLIETLRSDGFDAVVLDFTDATDAVQKNGLVVAELIQQVQSGLPPTTSLALVGASMGGLCSRYALAWMEANALPHRVRTWISFDAPHGGADIPLGLQYWIGFFADQSTEAQAFLAALQRPAARQMLLHYMTDPPGATGTPDPMRATLLADFAAVGDWPALPRRVAMANGSGTGLDQGFAPGDQLIRYEYSSILVSLTGNVWSVPNQTSRTIFDGRLRILFSTTSRAVTVSGTQPWDGAPGGYRASMTQLDTTAAPYGDIVALHPAHCFIPAVSALALATGDPFFDIAGAPDLLALSPFDVLDWPAANQEHVLITPENATWLLHEIEDDVLAAPTERREPDAQRLLAGPNPFRGSTRLMFALPPGAVVAELSVLSVDGRLVRRLPVGGAAATSRSVTWDGRDDGGSAVRAGLYFVHMGSGGSGAVRRVVKLD